MNSVDQCEANTGRELLDCLVGLDLATRKDYGRVWRLEKSQYHAICNGEVKGKPNIEQLRALAAESGGLTNSKARKLIVDWFAAGSGIATVPRSRGVLDENRDGTIDKRDVAEKLAKTIAYVSGELLKILKNVNKTPTVGQSIDFRQAADDAIGMILSSAEALEASVETGGRK